MKNKKFIYLTIILSITMLSCDASTVSEKRGVENMEITLPEPIKDGEMSVEAAIYKRRSIRNYKNEAISKQDLSTLLFAAGGVTEEKRGLRSQPSAGAAYPLEIYVAVGDVTGIEKGIYHYDPKKHSIKMIIQGDKRDELSAIALGQRMIKNAPITIIYSAVFERITSRYGERGIMYTHMEIGHSSQNVYLQATALGMGTVAIGAFSESELHKFMKFSEKETPLYMMPVGKL